MNQESIKWKSRVEAPGVVGQVVKLPRTSMTASTNRVLLVAGMVAVVPREHRFGAPEWPRNNRGDGKGTGLGPAPWRP
jgi:hypothetical protein